MIHSTNVRWRLCGLSEGLAVVFSGQSLGVPPSMVYSTISTLYADVQGFTEDVALARINFTFARHDLDSDESVTASGEPCSAKGTSRKVDDRADGEREFDGVITCECYGNFTGPTCEVEVTVAESESDDTSTAAIVVSVVSVLVVLVLVTILAFILLERKRQQEAARKPIDFAEQLDHLVDQGLIRASAVKTADGIGPPEETLKVPVELKRTRIELIERIGGGAFGDVMKAMYSPPMSSIPEFPVAVKVLKGDPSSDEKSELLQEACVTVQFDHPNIVQMVGVVTSGMPYMLVLQLCDRGSLQSVLKKASKGDTPLSTDELLHHCVGIANGMAYLTSLNFVHRDLATRNVLIDARNNDKVSDFGLSRDLVSGDYYRAKEDAKMPVRWSALECILKQQFSEKSDVWAFGVTVYEIFTNAQTPYYGWTNSYVIEQVKEGFRLPPPPTCPDRMYDDVVYPCFEPDPFNRPTFSFLAERLKLLEKNEATWTVSSLEKRLTQLANGLRLASPPEAVADDDDGPDVTSAESMYEELVSSSGITPSTVFVKFDDSGKAETLEVQQTPHTPGVDWTKTGSVRSLKDCLRMMEDEHRRHSTASFCKPKSASSSPDTPPNNQRITGMKGHDIDVVINTDAFGKTLDAAVNDTMSPGPNQHTFSVSANEYTIYSEEYEETHSAPRGYIGSQPVPKHLDDEDQLTRRKNMALPLDPKTASLVKTRQSKRELLEWHNEATSSDSVVIHIPDALDHQPSSFQPPLPNASEEVEPPGSPYRTDQINRETEV